MAEIVKRSNHLRTDIRKAYAKLSGAMTLIILSVLALQISYYISLLIIGAMIIWIMIIMNHIEILKFGLEGEKEALDLLSKLPKSYKVLSDVHLVDGKKSSQIDFVIIGSNGLFIMESKHIIGEIKGREDDTYIQKIKISRSGDKYYKRMYNPIKQISGHKKGMDIFLKKNGFAQKAFPVLYFSNDCILNIESRYVKIINDPVLVIDYIKRHDEQGIYLPQKMQEEIANALKQLD